ncbi:MAG TPA: MFS transporter, partial [Candidatus Blautia merdavium]|nr:MFS transporter [Candidatus Blautia merdavium]
MFHLLLAVIYMAFISLGLPDALLGSAWPSMYTEFQVPVSYAGMISMIIAAGTIVSSLQSDRLTKKLGAGKVTAISVGMTALALFGFSVSHSFWVLCLWAVPYGLGAGSVDAALNNYVALHYTSRHMSWLHCMWGLGALTGPYIMGFILTAGGQWNLGYRSVSVIQVILTVIILCSLPLWKKRTDPARQQNAENSDTENPIGLRQAVKIAGVKEILITFFCYCAIEQTAG